MTANVQQHRPTTTRNLLAGPPANHQAPNQPINSYFNPFAFQNNGLSHYKIIQNFPLESVVIRNAHNPYLARPALSKYPTMYKQQLPNTILPQFNVQFGLPNYPTSRPQDVFSKPVEAYVRPTDNAKPKPQNYDPNAPEIFKPEVFKLPLDSDTAPQSLSQQQVKTAQQQQQQQNLGTLQPPANPYQQYQYKEEKFAPLPPSILGKIRYFLFGP